jgi:hypothetical protein
MAIDLDERKVERNEFRLGLAWTLATTLGLILGYLLVALVAGDIELGIVQVLTPIVSGILLGVAQWLELRGYVVNSHDWIINLAGGWVVGYTLGLYVVQALAKTPLGMLVGYIFFGLIIAVFQYPVLRREIPHVVTWILANVIGWTLGAYISQFVTGALFRNAPPNALTASVASVGITGLVAGIVTGIALVLIVRQPDQALQSSGR